MGGGAVEQERPDFLNEQEWTLKAFLVGTAVNVVNP